MRRIRVNNKTELRNALETIILKKIERGEKEILNEIIQAENSEQPNKNDYLNFLKRLKPVAFEFWPQFKLKLNIPFVCPDPIADWLFLNNYWRLYNQTYISPPSCIALGGLTTVPCGALCIKAGAYPINEGRINSWMYGTKTSVGIGFYFRNQGPGQTGETYRVTGGLTSKKVAFYFKSNTLGQIDDPGIPGINTWFRRQLKFYVSENHLIMRWEKQDNGNWVQVGNDVIDPNNSYYGSQTNYSGIYGAANDYFYACFDDTEIWKSS